MSILAWEGGPDILVLLSWEACGTLPLPLLVLTRICPLLSWEVTRDDGDDDEVEWVLSWLNAHAGCGSLEYAKSDVLYVKQNGSMVYMCIKCRMTCVLNQYVSSKKREQTQTCNIWYL